MFAILGGGVLLLLWPRLGAYKIVATRSIDKDREKVLRYRKVPLEHPVVRA
jgi:hypothetical protein